MSLKTVMEIPADVNWTPQPVALPEHFLRPTPPPIDDEDWPVWNKAQSYLPAGRRVRAVKCRRHALHVVKETRGGNVESVNPISCGDRATCPRCATAYAHERWWDHWSKLGVVALSNGVPVHLVEFRAAIPEWNASVRVAGCTSAENMGRLCPSTSGCPDCAKARPAHAAAARVEAEVAGWATDAWKAACPFSGGVRHTRLEQPDLFGPIELVITLHVPGVAVQTWPSSKVAGDAALAVGKVRFFALPDLTKLRAEWQAFIANVYGGTASLSHAAPTEPQELQDAFEWTHRSSFEAFARQIAEAEAVTPDMVPTFARACSLGITSTGGRSRQAQRSVWFGCFTGQAQTQTLNALKITVREEVTEATVRVVDSYRILDVGQTTVAMQSNTTGELRAFPREMVRLGATVDTKGRPTRKTSETCWVYDWSHVRKLRKQQGKRFFEASTNRGLNAGVAQIALSQGQFGLSARQNGSGGR